MFYQKRKKITKTFKTIEEARAFLQGVKFARDNNTKSLPSASEIFEKELKLGSEYVITLDVLEAGKV